MAEEAAFTPEEISKIVDHVPRTTCSLPARSLRRYYAEYLGYKLEYFVTSETIYSVRICISGTVLVGEAQHEVLRQAKEMAERNALEVMQDPVRLLDIVKRAKHATP